MPPVTGNSEWTGPDPLPLLCVICGHGIAETTVDLTLKQDSRTWHTQLVACSSCFRMNFERLERMTAPNGGLSSD
jgi:hypothetical protein